MKRILVIRYGAFGDIVMMMGAFRAIRAHHPTDRITALTTPPFSELLRASGYFDDVAIDIRARPWRIASWLHLVRDLRGESFDRVYDLQRNGRTGILFQLLTVRRQIEWSGIVRGGSHFVPDDPNDGRHISAKLEEQLAFAGIAEMLPLDLGWLTGDCRRFGLPQLYALLASGGAPQRPKKRASAACFAGLASHLLSRGIAPVLLGTKSERQQIDAIRARCPGAIDLCDRTSFGDIAELARGAVGAVGNDTGLMHLTAAVGCASLVLFSSASDPRLVSPRARCVRVVQRDKLADLTADEAIAAWEAMLS